MSPIRVILWDVYSTLLKAKRGDLESLIRREPELRAAFEQTVANFRLALPADRLHRLFLDCLVAERDAALARGVAHPEVRVDEIWFRILEKIETNEPTLNYAREVALYFERQANPKQLMPAAFETLTTLNRCGLRQGIISNAQFYTAIELSELLREESDCAICSYESLFESDLVFFSYQLGVGKPDLTAFHRAIERLAADDIPPDQCLMVGDSYRNDVVTAREVGMLAAWFAPGGEDPPDAGPQPDYLLRSLGDLEEVV